MRIDGSTIVVTGASSGIGAAAASALAGRGGRVALLSRRRDALKRVVNEIHCAGGVAFPYEVDLVDHEAVRHVFETIRREMGPVDILVNNAGVGRFLFVEETPPEEAMAMISVPYLAAFFSTQAVLPEMLRRNRGLILFVSSAASQIVWPGATGYVAARWALRGFYEALREDLRTTDLLLSLVLLGKTRTSYFVYNPGSEERIPRLASLIPELSAEQAAQVVVTAILRDKRWLVAPRMLRIFLASHRMCPRFIQWLVSRTGARKLVVSTNRHEA